MLEFSTSLSSRSSNVFVISALQSSSTRRKMRAERRGWPPSGIGSKSREEQDRRNIRVRVNEGRSEGHEGAGVSRMSFNACRRAHRASVKSEEMEKGVSFPKIWRSFRRVERAICIV